MFSLKEQGFLKYKQPKPEECFANTLYKFEKTILRPIGEDRGVWIER
jgi:hypothetical protein